jgi:hypothetical protein
MAGSPESARLKLQRAYDHITDFDAAIQRFMHSKPAAFYVDRNFDRFEQQGNLLRVKLETPAPTLYWGAIVGDALTNALAALDHAVCALTSKSSCEGLGYPIFRSEKEWQQPWRRDSKHTAPEHMTEGLAAHKLAVIERFQPYPGRDQCLWILKRLANYDKHRAIHVVAMATTLLNLGARSFWGSPVPEFEIVFQNDRVSLEEDAVIGGFRMLNMGTSMPEMNMNPTFRINVLFSQDTPEVPGADVLMTLRQVVGRAEEAVAALFEVP